MGRYSGKSCRLLAMLALTLSFMLVEVIVGHMTHSLALIADAFHMLSDTLALIVGLTSVKVSDELYITAGTLNLTMVVNH